MSTIKIEKGRINGLIFTLDLRLVRLGLDRIGSGNQPDTKPDQSHPTHPYDLNRRIARTQAHHPAQAADHRCKYGSFPTPFKMPITLSLGRIQVSKWSGDEVTLQAWPVKQLLASLVAADFVALIADQQVRRFFAPDHADTPML